MSKNDLEVGVVNEGRAVVRMAGEGEEQTPPKDREELLNDSGIRREHRHGMCRTSQTSAHASQFSLVPIFYFAHSSSHSFAKYNIVHRKTTALPESHIRTSHGSFMSCTALLCSASATKVQFKSSASIFDTAFGCTESSHQEPITNHCPTSQSQAS
jgi:hypothetical protein